METEQCSSKKVPAKEKAKHQCSICLKSVSSRFSLKEHLWSHKGLKPYTCLDCDKCFNHCSNLVHHCHKYDHDKGPFLDPNNNQNLAQLGRMGKKVVAKVRSKKRARKPKFLQTSLAKNVEKHGSSNCIVTQETKAKSPLRKHTPLRKQSKKQQPQNAHCNINLAQLTGFLFRCGLCHKDFRNVADAIRHKGSHLNNFKCRYCDKVLKSKAGLVGHERIHNKKRVHRKGSISSLVADKTKLYQTESKGTRVQSNKSHFKCDICGYEFTSFRSLNGHRAWHFRKSFQCINCKQSFLTSQLLNRHYQSCKIKPLEKVKDEMKALEKPFVKSYLRNLPERKANRANQQAKNILQEKTLSNKPQLNTKLECKVCGKVFAYALRLFKHERWHAIRKESPKNSEATKPSVTGKSDCKIRISRRGLYKNEKSDDEFPCEVCEKKFTSKAVLEKHHRIHTSESAKQREEFPCDICEKTFRSKAFLEKHYRIHTGESAYQCEYCHKGFLHKTSYKKHMSTKWGDDVHVKKTDRSHPSMSSSPALSVHSVESTVSKNSSHSKRIVGSEQADSETMDSVNQSEVNEKNPVPIGIIQNVNVLFQNKLIPIGVRLEADMVQEKKIIWPREEGLTDTTGIELVTASSHHPNTPTSSQMSQSVMNLDRLGTRDRNVETVLAENVGLSPHLPSETFSRSHRSELEYLAVVQSPVKDLSTKCCESLLAQNRVGLENHSSKNEGTSDARHPSLSAGTSTSIEETQSRLNRKIDCSLPENVPSSQETMLLPNQDVLPIQKTSQLPYGCSTSSKPTIQFIPSHLFAEAFARSQGSVVRGNSTSQHLSFGIGSKKNELVSNSELLPCFASGTTVNVGSTASSSSAVDPSRPQQVPHLLPEVAVIQPQTSDSQEAQVEPRSTAAGVTIQTKIQNKQHGRQNISMGTELCAIDTNEKMEEPIDARGTVAFKEYTMIPSKYKHIASQCQEEQRPGVQMHPLEHMEEIVGLSISTTEIIGLQTLETEVVGVQRPSSDLGEIQRPSSEIVIQKPASESVGIQRPSCIENVQHPSLGSVMLQRTTTGCMEVQRPENIIKNEPVDIGMCDISDTVSTSFPANPLKKIKNEPGLFPHIMVSDGPGFEKDDPIAIDSDSDIDTMDTGKEVERPLSISDLIKDVSSELVKSKLAAQGQGVLSVGLVYSKKKSEGHKTVPVGIVHHQPKQLTEVINPSVAIKQEVKTSNIMCKDDIIILD